MRVPLDWLKEFVDIPASADEVADRLTMIGLEVEGQEIVNGDTVYEVNVTPNRPDCLSILGIAREVAAAFRIPLKMPVTEIKGDLPPSDINVRILDPDLCNRYAGRSIKGVTVSDSPDWVKERLEKCGIRALNNIVDITNYVLLELGHPLHAFDADKLANEEIRIAVAGEDRSIVTLDEIERRVPQDSLLIWDAHDTVAIAGVMGGEASSVTFDTKNIFLESAYFNPLSVRRTSKRLGLSTESSYRFERGTDIVFLEMALNRASLLIRETAGGMIHEIVDAYPVKHKPRTFEVSYDRVNTLLGTNVQKDIMLEMLERIGVGTDDKGTSVLVTSPSFRRDIHEFVDIVEEIARCYHYSNIPVTIPKTVLSDGMLNAREIYIGRIRESLRKSGFNEVINYSFMNSSDLDLLVLPANDYRRQCIELKNPLRQEESLMRTTLLPSLIHNFAYNLARGTRDIRFFEISKIFIHKGEALPVEEMCIGGIYYQDSVTSIWRDTVASFFKVKGALQALFDELKISGYSWRPSSEIFLHSGKSADIMRGEQKLGFMGELGPHITDTLNLKIQRPEIIIFELNLERLYSILPEKITFRQIPRYPSVERDMAIIIDDSVASEEVINAIRDFKSDLLERVEQFDFYKGKNIPENKKSLGFRITYRSSERTLTDTEVESIHQGLVGYVLSKTRGELRGPYN